MDTTHLGVGNAKFHEAVRQNVLVLLVGTVTTVGHLNVATEAATDDTVDSLRAAPFERHTKEVVCLVANELRLTFLDDLVPN